MSTLQISAPVCNECSGHCVVTDNLFGGMIPCPKCSQPPATVRVSLVDLVALTNRLASDAADAGHLAVHHGATHERDFQAVVARGLRLAVETLVELYGAPVDLAERDEELAEAC